MQLSKKTAVIPVYFKHKNNGNKEDFNKIRNKLAKKKKEKKNVSPKRKEKELQQLFQNNKKLSGNERNVKK